MSMTMKKFKEQVTGIKEPEPTDSQNTGSDK